MSPTLGWNNAGTSAGATGGILKSTPTAEVIAPQVNVYVAPQVDVPNSWVDIAGTSAGATGGILKSTPAVEAIAPQVVIQMASVLPSSVQQPPEVYIPAG